MDYYDAHDISMKTLAKEIERFCSKDLKTTREEMIIEVKKLQHQNKALKEQMKNLQVHAEEGEEACEIEQIPIDSMELFLA